MKNHSLYRGYNSDMESGGGGRSRGRGSIRGGRGRGSSQGGGGRYGDSRNSVSKYCDILVLKLLGYTFYCSAFSLCKFY